MVDYLIDRTQTILKLRKVFKLGYFPNRGENNYLGRTKQGYKTAYLTNCLGHAFFNLTDNIFEKFGFTDQDCDSFTGFYNDKDMPLYYVERAMLNFVLNTGLEIKKLDNTKLSLSKCILPKQTILKKNERLVALYFAPQSDYHFITMENSHLWTGKMGLHEYIERYSFLPKKIKTDLNTYKFYSVYKVTYPKAKVHELQ